MYRETELRALYDRLKAQYPQYQLDFSGDCLTIARLRSRAVINCEGAKLYTGETLYDQFTSEDAFYEPFSYDLPGFASHHPKPLVDCTDLDSPVCVLCAAGSDP